MIKNIFRALRYRNYRLFFFGQGISLVGTWMQQVAVSWLVYRLTDSAFVLGWVCFAGQIPAFFGAPLAGVIADRYNRHRLLLLTQTLAMAQALVLAVLVLNQQVTVNQLVVLSVVLGLIHAFDIPVRQAFTVDMLEDRADLSNAIALNSSMVNLAKLLGPSVAGILIAALGEGPCFLINALSYTAVIAAILRMRVPVRPRAARPHPILRELREGFRYAYHSLPIRWILMLMGVLSLVGGFSQTLLPVFARDIFHGGAQTLGFLVGASGLGALMGALYLASRKSVLGLGRVIAWTAGIFGAGVMAFAVSRSLWVSLALMLVTGFGVMVEMAASNTILQTIVEEDKRGRVMSLFTMAFIGMAPLGSLLAGIMEGHIGARSTLFVGGAVCLASSALFSTQLPLIREKVRVIYRQKGILPDLAGGISSSTS